MEINRENYEMYFLDYHEGRLEPGQVAELLVFLQANPQFREEFETYEDVLLVPDMSVSFYEKNSLKKNNAPDTGAINNTNYETYFIASTEGLLSPEEQKLLSAFLNLHSELKAGYEFYKKTHLEPDLKITFPAKARLKRSVLNMRRFYYYSLATAASLALLLSIYINTGIRQGPKLAVIKKESLVKASTTIAPKNQGKYQPGQVVPVPVINNKSIASKNSKISLLIQATKIAEANVPERFTVNEINILPCAGVTSRDLVEPKYAFIRQSRNGAVTYANLYDQVKLADHMKNDPVLAPVVSSPKNIIRSGVEKLGSVFTGKDVPVDRNKINFWTIADLGISGYNLLTDKDLKLLTQSNDKGQVEAYALKGDAFEFARKLKK